MDVRRLLAVFWAYVTKDRSPEEIRVLAESLNDPFPHELAAMPENERRSIQYRIKARQIGADRGQRALMEAFKLPKAAG